MFTPHKLKAFESNFKLKIEYQGFKTKTVRLNGQGVPHDKQKRVLGQQEELEGGYNHEYTEGYEQFDLNRDLGPQEYDEVAREKYKLKDGAGTHPQGDVEGAEGDKDETKKEPIKTTTADPNRKTIIEPMRELYKDNNEKNNDYIQIWTEQKELRRMFKEDKQTQD